MATILHNKINQGSTAIKGSYVGAAPVKNAYLGSKLVYDVLDTTLYDTPTISLSYSTTPVVAKGGTLSPTLSYSQKWRYIGYSGTTYEQTAKTSGATVTYTISGSGASIDKSSGVVTWASRGTTIGNERSATVTVKVEMNGKSALKTFTVKQAGNYVTSISASGTSMSYTAINAGATSSAAPSVSTGTVTYTFSSTKTSTTAPSETYGSLTISKGFKIANKTTNGFKDINTSTGALTATSRGTTYGASNRASATVTCTITYTWTPTSSYNAAGTKTATASPTATCSQKPNLITALALTNAAGGSITTPGTVAASGNSSLSLASASAASAGVTMTFSSESTSASYSDYVTLSISYAWSGSNSMVAYENGGAASQTVNVKSRGTSYSNSTRSCELTRTATITATLKSGYSNAAKATTTATAKVTITQAKNVITGVSVTVGAGTIAHSAGTVSAAGGEVSITNSASGSYSGTLTFSSTATAATSDTYGSWAASYSWSESDSASMLTWTAANATTMKVTVASRGTTFSTSTRSATMTRKYTATFTLNSTYDDGATSGTNNKSTSVTITLGANKIASISSVTVSAGSISYNSGNTVGAGGLTATTGSSAPSASAKVKLVSGSEITATSTHGSFTAGPTYSWSESDSAGMISFTSSNAATISVTTASRGTTKGDARSATLKRTASYTYTVTAANSSTGSALTKDGSGVASTTIKQEANAITSYENPTFDMWYSSGAGNSGTPVSAGGGASAAPTYTISLKANYTSGANGAITPSVTSAKFSVSSKNTAATASVNETTGVVQFGSLGTTEQASGKYVDILLTVISHGKTGTDHGYCYLASNSKGTSIDHYTYSNMAAAIGSGLTAAGGSAALTASATRTPLYKWTSGSYTAGSAGTVDITSSCTFAITHKSQSTSTSLGTHNNSLTNFSISGKTLSHSSMGTYNGYDHVTVRATASGLSGISTASKSTYVDNRPTTGTLFGVDSLDPSSTTKTAAAQSFTLSWRQLKRTSYTWPSGAATTYSSWTAETSAGITAVASDSDWITRSTPGTSNSSGINSCTVSLTANTSTSLRTGKVTVKNGTNYVECTITLSGHTVSKVEIKSVSVSGGALTNPSNYAAAGATQSVANKTAASCTVTLTLTYNSGYTADTTSHSSYGTLSGPTYSWKVDSGVASLTSSNAASLNVSMPNNTTTSSRSSVVRRTASYTYTLSSSWGSASKSGSGYTTATCTQNAGSRTLIITPSVTEMGAFAAAGQSKTSVITYTTKWNGITTATGTALSGYTITENSDSLGIVSASGTTGTVTVTSSNNKSTSTGSFKYTISKNGYTSATITGSITKGSKTIASYNAPAITFSYSTIDAATTTVTPTKTWTQTANYVWNGVSGADAGTAQVANGSITSFAECNSNGTNGDYLGGMSINTSTGVATWTKNTSTSARTGYVKATVTSNGKSNTKVASSTQNGDYISSCGTPTISLSYGTNAEPTANATQLPTVSGSVTNTWLAAGNKAGNYSISYKILSGSGATVNASTGVVTWSAANTGSSTKSVTIRATITSGNGCGKTAYADAIATLKADYATSSYYVYSNITVTNNGSASDIPASGGTVKGSGGTGTQTKTLWYKWKSGKNDTSSTVSNCTVKCGTYSDVSANSLGTTEKARTKIGNSTATLTGEGSKTATVSVGVYQAANTRSISGYGSWKTVSSWSGWADYDYPYSDTTGDYWASCSIGSGITAGGGSATVSKSAGHTVYKWKRQRRSGTQYRDVYYTYTSGSESTGTNESSQTAYDYQKVSNGSSAASDSCTIAITNNGNSRFSLSGTTLSHSTMGTSATTDTCTVRCTNSSSTSATGDASVSVVNKVTESPVQGTYYRFSKFSLNTTLTISAGGGSVLLSMTVQRRYLYKDKYTSGSYSSAYYGSWSTITPASGSLRVYSNTAGVTPGTITYAANSSCSITVGANSGAARTILITGQYRVNSSSTNPDCAAGPIYTSQAAGAATYTITSISTAAYPALVPAAGGNISLYLVANYSKTENGSTTTGSVTYSTNGSNGTLSGLSISGAGATINTTTGTVTWAANTGAQRTATVTGTFTYKGASKSFTATAQQAAGQAQYWVRITTTQAATISGGVGTVGLFSQVPSGVSVSSTCMTSPTVTVTGGLPSSVGTSPSLTSSLKSIASGSVFTTKGYANSSTGGVGGCPDYNSASSNIMNPMASNPNHPVSMMRTAAGGNAGTAPVTIYRDTDTSAYIGIRYASGSGLAWIPCKVRLVAK